jgi:hypothetical protein
VQQPVSYIGADGQKKQGVASVPAAQSGESTDYWDAQRAGYQDMYDEAVRANNDAAERAAQQAREAAEAQRQALATGYQGTNRQLYRDYMENRRRLPQQMAAAGYNGGLSESAQLRLRNSYEEALAENERSRMGQQASADANLAQRLYEIQAQADAGNQQARQQRLSYEQALREQQRQEERQELAARADTLAAAGDFSGYRALGYSQSEIDAMTRYWLAGNPDMTSAWIAGHPEDAARLGISNPNTWSEEYVPVQTPEEQAEEAVNAGMGLREIRQILQEMIRGGEITPEQGESAWQAAWARNERAGATPNTGSWGPWVAGNRAPR